jgi:hypothetical protein
MYISYRLKDMKVSLSFMLEKDLPIESGTWLISGPEHLIQDYVSFSSLILENSQITDKDSDQGWISFNDFDAAKSDFRNLLRTIQETCGIHKS